jgi:hypothetical protein
LSFVSSEDVLAFAEDDPDPREAELKTEIEDLQNTINTRGLEAARDGGFDEKVLTELTALAAEKEKLAEELAGLNRVEGIVMATIIERFGKEDSPVDWQNKPVVWGQEKEATRAWLSEVIQADDPPGELVIMPVGEGVKPFKKTAAGHFALAVAEHVDKTLHVIAYVEPASSLSALCKKVATAVGKPDATNGVNGVKEFDAEGYTVFVNKQAVVV